MPKTNAERDDQLASQKAEIELLKTAVQDLRPQHEVDVATLRAELAASRRENEDLRGVHRRLEDRVHNLLVTTIFAFASALVAVVVAFLKK